jgi:DNA polymerase-3 subunit gamma/tau
MVGQQAVTQTLKTQILSGKLSHAYLLTGSRGTGKTSSAKILAKAVNCENPQDGNPCNCCNSCRAIDSGSCMDVLEIDAASNNGVDNVRDLRDDAIYSPSQVKKRVYIIDEVHMLSLSAFNALLKIIEEPPEHLIFILATTELHKVPATILSRCQRFSFRRISQEDIASRLQYVAYQEDIDLDESAARILARLADGGLRDALSLLDQCASATVGELNAERVYACLGIAGIQQCASLMEHIADRDCAKALSLLNRFYAEGKDMGALMDEMACLARDFLVLKAAPNEGVGMLSGVATDAEAMALVNRFSYGELVRMIGIIQDTLAGFNRSASRRMDAELCIVNLCQPELDADLSSVIARITKLEDQIRTGVVLQKTTFDSMDVPVQALPEDPAIPAQAVAVEVETTSLEDEAPVGFWADIVAGVKAELSPAFRGFFAISPNSPIRGILSGDRLLLICTNKYVIEMVNKPDIISLVARKASAKLGRPVRVAVTDGSGVPESSAQLEQLLDFGRSHSDIIKISED